MPRIEDRATRAVACVWRVPAGRKVAHAVELMPGAANAMEIDRYRHEALCGATPPRRWSFPVYVGGPDKRCKRCEKLYSNWGIPDEPLPVIVDWRKVALSLLETLDNFMELPRDLGEIAPEGDNDYQTEAYRTALIELGKEIGR